MLHCYAELSFSENNMILFFKLFKTQVRVLLLHIYKKYTQVTSTESVALYYKAVGLFS